MASLEDREEHKRPEWMDIYEPKKFSFKQFFPPLAWVPQYIRAYKGTTTDSDSETQGDLPFSLSGDIIAGCTVGFMLVPQCLAFSLLAGLPLEAGLYSSFLPLLSYAFFGNLRQVQTGPTALMCLLTGSALDAAGLEDPQERLAAACLLACMVGGLSILLGLLRFGFVVDFMSHSVMTAFCTAAGITISTSQVKHLLGVHLERHHYWWETFIDLIKHIGDTHGPTFVLGGSLLAMLLFLKAWKGAGSAEKRAKSRIWRCLPKKKEALPFKILKLVADLSSVLCVIIGWIWAMLYRKTGVEGVAEVRDSGAIDKATLKFVMPGDGVSSETVSSLVVAAFVISIVGFLETVAVGGKFAMASRYEYEPNQELIALGIGNVFSSFSSGFPVTGSFSRTAVNAMFGATSPVAVFLSSIIVLLATLFLLPIVKYLPLASLAPIIIQGAIGVVSFAEFGQAFRASRLECGVMVCTFIVSLGLTVKEGLGVGFALSILKTMHELANPNLAVVGMMQDGSFRDVRNHDALQQLPTAVVVRMDARMNFVNARKMKDFAARAVDVRERRGDKIAAVIIDCFTINNIDLTGCETLASLAQSLQHRGQKLLVANIKGPVGKALALAGADKHIEHFGGTVCIDMKTALNVVAGASESKDAQMTYRHMVDRVETANIIKQSSSSFVKASCGMGNSNSKSKGSLGDISQEHSNTASV